MQLERFYNADTVFFFHLCIDLPYLWARYFFTCSSLLAVEAE